MFQIDDELSKQIKYMEVYLLSKGWTKNKLESMSLVDAMHEQLMKELDEAGFVQVYSKFTNDAIFRRFLHPVSGWMYRWEDVNVMVGPNPVDEEEFRQKATGWSKQINEMLSSVSLKEDDLVIYGIKDEECFIHDVRPITSEDLKRNEKASQKSNYQ